MKRWALCCAVGGSLLAGGQASAQKYPGQTVAPADTPPAYAPPAYSPALPPPPPRVPAYRAPSFAPPPPLAGGAEVDPQARAEAERLPLDPATAGLQSRLPTDVPGTIRRLGLHVPNGTRLDLRGARVTPPEVVNALQH